ncbi:MAG: 2,3-bisphosphoglycerate-independent phosphoglycerate mutase [Schleiferiaceae bacterium]|jgi:2,3-bisphosphoglycerate-independent phosphoglycerate mutase|nr:2,3-bisphosphoglycerate-independent phosphoglycerate mutase [Schleiferiaceae bacterium]MDP4728486.1 2,3-bisphosphoglycerate-independent phosphoglycerate mutase [Schleiferiaceae bacterium]MDP4750028.1 2,3-bisphosphoglycerate-independent phosphoglycerate mutase [Schleiferiaceae bacterium]MDP4859506.1 2,3-bisphosphoglycerate-independent phosphoglycerate mutase [Schleiferiaceae bacterium]MDP4901147.1 2,3-bisphosphoglycerate-independent phosphoglycerate mutase [Schleiferiaceae bacterium]
MKRKAVLMILDGWGIAKDKAVSAVDLAHTPFMDGLLGNYPNAQLEASGLAVGLPEGQMGNSEVGHTNLGAGRVVYQDLVKISLAAQDGSLAENAPWLRTVDYCKSGNKPLHLMGLVSNGGVHSHTEHLYALLRLARAAGIEHVFVHAFTDGRDTDPKSGHGFLKDLLKVCAETGAQLATVTGRYFAMDRDNRWERVSKAYRALVNGAGTPCTDVLQALTDAYAAGVTDEFLEPLVCVDDAGKPIGMIQEDDAVLVFNFRTDRGREITQMLSQQAFHEHNTAPLRLHFTTMTRYDASFRGVDVLFDKEDLRETLGEVLSQRGKRQLRIAETEKYPHVTFFFSGGQEEPFPGEERIMCPSPKVATYDLQPEMSAPDLRDALIPVLQAGEVDFVCLNFANPDMVGHTGDLPAAIRAVETVDSCAQAVVSAGLPQNYTFFIIADHGNADCMRNPDGTPNTAHTTQPVPFFAVGPETADMRLNNGVLGDIAPTVLRWLNLAQPASMTGQNLLHP